MSPASSESISSGETTPKTRRILRLSTERNWSIRAYERFTIPLRPGSMAGYKAPWPGVPVRGTMAIIGKRWSRITSGSLSTTQGRTPRCSWPTVGSRATRTTVPRSSVTSALGSILRLAPSGLRCQYRCLPVRPCLRRAGSPPTRQSRRRPFLPNLHADSGAIAPGAPVGGGQVHDVRHPARTCCGLSRVDRCPGRGRRVA